MKMFLLAAAQAQTDGLQPRLFACTLGQRKHCCPQARASEDSGGRGKLCECCHPSSGPENSRAISIRYYKSELSSRGFNTPSILQCSKKEKTLPSLRKAGFKMN